MERNKKRDQYKHLISFFSAVILLGMLTSQFAGIWYNDYLDVLALPFYRRGHWAVIGIYAVVTFLFFRVYNAFRVGYLQKTDALI